MHNSIERFKEAPLKVSCLLALFSGLLLTVFSPLFSFSLDIAIALVPLIEAAWGREWFYAGRLGFLTGLVHFGTLLW